MLWERDGSFETGTMERPFERGAMFQVYVDSVITVAAALSASGWPLYAPLRDVWRRWGDREGGQREFLVQDPDGYLIIVAEHIGERPLRERSRRCWQRICDPRGLVSKRNARCRLAIVRCARSG